MYTQLTNKFKQVCQFIYCTVALNVIVYLVCKLYSFTYTTF